MINFFRNIRRQLANENKFQRYMRYAVGEVLLIMLGIFMALQLQNWNENRKKEEQFKNTLEQLYNKITDDSWYFEYSVNTLNTIIPQIDNLLNYREDQGLDSIPELLWNVSFNYKSIQAKSLAIIDNLEYNLDDPKQVKLANQLLDYQELIKLKYIDFAFKQTELEKYLIEHNLSYPKVDVYHIDKGQITDSTYYTPKDLQNALAIITNDNFKTRLKTHRSAVSYDYLDFKSLNEESVAMLKRIKTYYPEVKLLFEDVGIIGTSINGFNDVGAHSTPMTLTDEDKSIWEIELYLKEGRVKFRCRDSWAINWGGTTFPKGEPASNGPDIPVTQAGNYHVVLNLTSNTYEFIKQDD